MSKCKENAGLFNGMEFYIIDSTISIKRLAILTKIITQNQGTYSLSSQKSITQYKNIESIVVLIDPHISEAEFIKACKIQEITTLNVLNISYLSECIKQKEVLPYKEFMWNKLIAAQLIKGITGPVVKRKHFQIASVSSQNVDIAQESQIIFENEINESSSFDLTQSYDELSMPSMQMPLQEIKYQDDQASIQKQAKLKKEVYWDKKKDKFAMQSAKTNKNEHITSALERLYNCYEAENDQGRLMGYRRAIGILKSFPEKIESLSQVNNIRGIGPKTKSKIKQILLTGSVKRISFMENSEKIKSYRLFTQIYGVGHQMANKIYQSGIKSIEELRKNPALLNDIQKIGLKYYEELIEKMSRETVSLIKKKVHDACAQLLPDIEFTCECAGSYRRGRDLCGDADIIITKKSNDGMSQLFDDLINKLEIDGFITDTLSKSHSDHGSFTFMGICSYEKHHRIDIKLYSKSQYAFALLYFTGSAHFNRSMRLFARKKGYSLSDHGISEVERVNKSKVWSGETAECYTEKEIFNFLHLEYKEPCERDI